MMMMIGYLFMVMLTTQMNGVMAWSACAPLLLPTWLVNAPNPSNFTDPNNWCDGVLPSLADPAILINCGSSSSNDWINITGSIPPVRGLVIYAPCVVYIKNMTVEAVIPDGIYINTSATLILGSGTSSEVSLPTNLTSFTWTILGTLEVEEDSTLTLLNPVTMGPDSQISGKGIARLGDGTISPPLKWNGGTISIDTLHLLSGTIEIGDDTSILSSRYVQWSGGVNAVTISASLSTSTPCGYAISQLQTAMCYMTIANSASVNVEPEGDYGDVVNNFRTRTFTSVSRYFLLSVHLMFHDV
jgi:hypothetical protein